MRNIDKKFFIVRKRLEESLKVIDMTDKSINLFMQCVPINYCDKCETPNMTPIYHNEKDKYIMYECDKCNYTWLDDLR